jgi:hypothetical protein
MSLRPKRARREGFDSLIRARQSHQTESFVRSLDDLLNVHHQLILSWPDCHPRLLLNLFHTCSKLHVFQNPIKRSVPRATPGPRLRILQGSFGERCQPPSTSNNSTTPEDATVSAITAPAASIMGGVRSLVEVFEIKENDRQGWGERDVSTSQSDQVTAARDVAIASISEPGEDVGSNVAPRKDRKQVSSFAYRLPATSSSTCSTR